METCQAEMKDWKEKKLAALVRCIGRQSGGVPSRLVDYQGGEGVGGWLGKMPSPDMCTTMSPVKFRDGLWIRMDLPLIENTIHCNGCGAVW